MNIEEKFATIKKEIEDYIKEYDISVYDLRQRIYKERLNKPTKPLKPRLKNNPTLDETKNFAKELKDYESKKVIYDETLKSVNEFNFKLEDLLIEYIKKDSGLYDIPEQYQSKIWIFAWDRGHSFGYSDVHNILCELVEIFN